MLLALISFRLSWPIRLLVGRWVPPGGLDRLKLPLSTDACDPSREPQLPEEVVGFLRHSSRERRAGQTALGASRQGQ